MARPQIRRVRSPGNLPSGFVQDFSNFYIVSRGDREVLVNADDSLSAGKVERAYDRGQQAPRSTGVVVWSKGLKAARRFGRRSRKARRNMRAFDWRMMAESVVDDLSTLQRSLRKMEREAHNNDSPGDRYLERAADDLPKVIGLINKAIDAEDRRD